MRPSDRDTQKAHSSRQRREAVERERQWRERDSGERETVESTAPGSKRERDSGAVRKGETVEQ
jgi:hypothetical protein